MESISELISEIEKEDDILRKECEERLQKQREKYRDLEHQMNELKDGLQMHTENILKQLDNLVANKHTIENAMKQTENIKGLPIPHEQHEVAVQLISQMSSFLNNNEVVNKTSIFNLENIFENITKVSEKVANNWKECYTEINEVEALKNGTASLTKLISTSEEDELTMSDTLNSSIFNIDKVEANNS